MDYHQNDQADAEALANSLERDYYLPQAYDNDSPQTYSGLLSNDGLTYEPEVQEQCISPLDVEGGIAFDDVVTDGLFHHIDFGRDSPSRSTLVNNNDPFTLDTITANQEQDDVIPSRHASSTRRSCRIQPSSLESADPLSPVEHTASHLSRPKRTKISLPERAMLDAYFRHTPYPSKGDIARLAKETKLANQVIETWFNNARTRKTAAEVASVGNTGIRADVNSKQGYSEPEIILTPATVAAYSSIREYCLQPSMFGASPDERFPIQSTTQDPVPTEFIQTSLEGSHPYLASPIDVCEHSPTNQLMPLIEGSKTCRHGKIRCSRDPPSCTNCQTYGRLCLYEDPVHHEYQDISSSDFLPIPASRHHSSMRAFSPTGSDRSTESQASNRSVGSRISEDLRGHRRGRKRWISPTPPALRRQEMELFSPDSGISTSSVTETKTVASIEHSKTLPYFCTWPACNKSFPNRSSWARHEEAIHYCPYHWVCCQRLELILSASQCFICDNAKVPIGHLITGHKFKSCVVKSERSRSFTREDQFLQHIKGVHAAGKSISIPRNLVSSSKRNNPSISRSAFHCGFCGIIFTTWVQRQDHVFAHLKERVCKSAWWPDRLPVTSEELSSTGPYTCSTCHNEFQSIQVALDVHPRCETYSCRYLHDWHSLFLIKTSLPTSVPDMVQCCLCGYVVVCDSEAPNQDEIDCLRGHAESHDLRKCPQEVFDNRDVFQEHMQRDHAGAVYSDVSNWRATRFLSMSGEDLVTCVTLESINSSLCNVGRSYYCHVI